MRSASNHYTATAIMLHWIIAILIFGAFPLGLYMHELPASAYKIQLYSWHKWTGITVLLLVMLRMLWRMAHQPPPLPATMVRWQHRASHIAHTLLYGLILAVPLSGWLMSSAKGFQTVWFGIMPLPDLVSKNKELADLLHEMHEILNYSLLGLVGVHVAAALKHHFIDRDGILARMLPFQK